MSYSRRQAWFALGVLFAINLMNFYDRQIIAAVTEPIRKEWNLSDTDMGILGTAFVLIYAAVGVPLGRLSDRFSRTRILSGGVTVWTLLTALSGATWNYASMFAARLGVGVGEASCAPAANSLVGDLFPPHQRARALSIFMLGLPLGIFFSNWLSGAVVQSRGWRAAFLWPAYRVSFAVCSPCSFESQCAARRRERQPGQRRLFCRSVRARLICSSCERRPFFGLLRPALCTISTCTRSTVSCRPWSSVTTI